MDPATAQILNPITVNEMTNFGHEYLWHCHILSHEESDMMRPIVLNPNTKVDILWRNYTSLKTSVWYMDETTKVLEKLIAPTDAPNETDPNWKIVGRGDFNGDNKIDILWRNLATNNCRVWFMDGTVYLGVYDFTDKAANSSWNIFSTGDFNNDGKIDILWRNDSQNKTAAWYMGYDNVNHNTLVKLGEGSIATNPGTNWRIVGTGDFNGDGKPDIVWRNSTNAKVSIWTMNWPQRIADLQVSNPLNNPWTIQGVGDFNSDINPDLIWRNTSNGQNRVWFMDGNIKIGEAPLTSASTPWNIVGY